MRNFTVLLLLALAAAPAASATGPAVQAVKTNRPIGIDGILDEEAWRQAPVTADFGQKEPVRGAQPSQRTEVRLAYDEDALYVAATLYDSAPDSITYRLTRRDGPSVSDLFTVFLDPFLDRRTGYYFGVTVAGTQMDGLLMNDGLSDDSWDAVWNSRVRRDAHGWTVEMRIPFSQLRFHGGERMVWGIDMKRSVQRLNEEEALVVLPRDQSGFVSHFRDLAGLDGVRPRHALELTPYSTLKAENLHYPTGQPGNLFPSGDPYHRKTELSPAAGGDLRMSLGSNLTLNAAVNPDFSQVEVDPAVVNLSDYETYYQEKRPFFTEGLSVFQVGNNGANDYWGFAWPEPTFFYSRRIGRAPQGDTPGAEHVDRPSLTRILGAATVTGQPAGGWKFGTLHALTALEQARLSTGGVETRSPVEPLSYYGVARGLREFNDRRQGLGVMTTAAVRSFDGAVRLEPELNRTAVASVVDGWTFLGAGRTWVLSGWSAATNITGTRERINAVQRGPAHYLQRPDAGYLGYDPRATSLTGYGARVWLNKQEGRFLSNSAIGFLSPGFDTNDLGFTWRTDVVNAHVGAGWQWSEPRGWRQYAKLTGALAAGWTLGGDPLRSMAYSEFLLRQRNQWSWLAHVLAAPEVTDGRGTRGGPLMKNPASISAAVSLRGNAQKPLTPTLGVSALRSADESWTWEVDHGVSWKPKSNLSLQFAPGLARGRTSSQYVTAIADPAASATYGKRYLFARLDQTTLAADVRVEYFATSTLSLQMYMQPLVSSGRYSGFKQLARPRSREFEPVGGPGAPSPALPDPDFNVRSLRGSTVLRWEYAPGSTVYLAWTQDRSNEIADGEFRLNESLTSIGRSPANNIFLVKVSRHFGA